MRDSARVMREWLMKAVPAKDCGIEFVMAGHSRPKDGVAALAYVPAIHAFPLSRSKAWMPGTRPGMTWRDW
jgi:hypothetical protein